MQTQTIKISLDNGATFLDAPQGVKIVFDNVTVPVDGKETDGSIQLTFTKEGVTGDLWGTRAEHLDAHVATQWSSVGDIVDDLLVRGE